MRGPSPAACTFSAEFLQEARDTVKRRTATMQAVQRFRLALLLHEVKKQSDKIEAAADAIGDAILSRLDDGHPVASSRLSRRSILSMQPTDVADHPLG